jgi:hypothetical protein
MSKNNSSKPKVMSEQFKMYIDELNTKIVAATEALKEVNRVKDLAGLPSIIEHKYVYEHFDVSDDENDDGEYDKLSEMFDLIKNGGLENEIDNAGWSTSSSYC